MGGGRCVRNWLSRGSERRVKSDGGAEGDRDEQEGRSARVGGENVVIYGEGLCPKKQ